MPIIRHIITALEIVIIAQKQGDVPSTMAALTDEFLGVRAINQIEENYLAAAEVQYHMTHPASGGLTTVDPAFELLSGGAKAIGIGLTLGALLTKKSAAGILGSAAKEGGSLLSAGEILRIENAATRIGKTITVVGSRASGKAGAYSDWDYIIEGGLKSSREWSKIKNSLPGARSILDNTPRNIDILPGPVWTSYPHITIHPR